MDQTATVVGTLAVGLGALIGDMIGMIKGGLLMALVSVVATMGGRTSFAKQLPVVRFEEVELTASPASCPLPKRDDLSSRLKRPDELRAKGLISDNEYADQRARVPSTIRCG